MPTEALSSTVAGRRKTTLFLAHVLLTFVLTTIGIACSAAHMAYEDLVYPSCLMLTVLFTWVLCTWFALRKTLFEPYPLFILATGLFNAGQGFLEVIGLNQSGVLGGIFPADILVPALYLVTIGVSFLHVGALLAVRQSSARAAEYNGPKTQSQPSARMAGLMLLALSVVPTVMLLRQSVSLVMDSGYMALFQGGSALSVTRVLSAFLIPGAIFLLVGSRRSPRLQLLCFAVVALYSVVYLFLGVRCTATTGLLAVLWGYDRSIRRIPRKVLIGGALVALVVFGLVQQTRQTAGNERLSWQAEYESLTSLEKPLTAPLAEMGGSLITVAHTLRLVPEIRDFDWGATYWYALLTIAPNFGWDVHPSIAHGLLADWLIKTIDPSIAAAGGGLGYSFIAEAYLNFGWRGAPIWFAILGYLLCRLFLMADGNDLAKQALVASFLSFVLVYPRGESAIILRGLVWYGLVPYWLMKMLAGGRRVSRTFHFATRLKLGGVRPYLPRTSDKAPLHV